MTQPAKGHEPSMEEILASIRRIIADEPGNNLRNEAVRDEAARERSWRHESLRSESPRSESAHRESPRSEGLRLDAPRTVIPHGDDARREPTRDNPSSEGLPHASPIGSMELREEACLPRSDAPAQPFGRNAAPALSAVPKESPESPPSGPSRHEGFSAHSPPPRRRRSTRSWRCSIPARAPRRRSSTRTQTKLSNSASRTGRRQKHCPQPNSLHRMRTPRHSTRKSRKKRGRNGQHCNVSSRSRRSRRKRPRSSRPESQNQCRW